MDHVARSIRLNAPAKQVWEVVGGFQGLPGWHPAVEASHKEEIGGVEHRRLDLAGGGEILEQRLGADGMSYAYEIIESPLPVDHYRAAVTVADAGDGTTVVTWASTFEPTAEGARGIIAGIYEAGFGALKTKFGG